MKTSDVYAFAMENFEQMQLERFYVDKPYIDAFAELTKLSNVEKLLADSQSELSATKFTNTAIQEMSELCGSYDEACASGEL